MEKKNKKTEEKKHVGLMWELNLSCYGLKEGGLCFCVNLRGCESLKRSTLMQEYGCVRKGFIKGYAGLNQRSVEVIRAKA